MFKYKMSDETNTLDLTENVQEEPEETVQENVEEEVDSEEENEEEEDQVQMAIEPQLYSIEPVGNCSRRSN